MNDGYNRDGYMGGEYNHQINVKLTNNDIDQINQINKHFFENEATNSMLCRILIRKGIQFYNKLK